MGWGLSTGPSWEPATGPWDPRAPLRQGHRPHHAVLGLGQGHLHLLGPRVVPGRPRPEVHQLLLLPLEPIGHRLDGSGPLLPAGCSGEAPSPPRSPGQPCMLRVLHAGDPEAQAPSRVATLPARTWASGFYNGLGRPPQVLPLLGGLHVEGALDDRGPLQTPDDERVGPGPLCLHQLALWRGPAGQRGRSTPRPRPLTPAPDPPMGTRSPAHALLRARPWLPKALPMLGSGPAHTLLWTCPCPRTGGPDPARGPGRP